jgi:DNA-binding beta-propeller fold protein YncE
MSRKSASLVCMFVLLSLVMVPLAVSSAQVAATASYKVTNRFSLGGAGGWDYLAVDSPARRVYIARSDRVMVIDADSGKLVAEIGGMERVHGVALAADLGRGFISSGGQGKVVAFHLEALKAITDIAAGKNPDALVYDSRWKRVWAFNGGDNSASVLDATSLAPVRTIALPGKPEFAVLDPHGQIYVNLEDKSAIARIDAHTMEITAQWPLAPCEAPTGLAIDVEKGRLFAGCGNAKMAILEIASGKLLATVPIGKRCDGVAFDPAAGAAVSANGEGTLTVVKETTAGKFEAVQTITTQASARTVAFDEATHSFLLPAGEVKPNATDRRQLVPGKFELLAVGSGEGRK